MSNPTSSDHPPHRFRFPKSVRLKLRREFLAVYKERMYHAAGPLFIYGRPNELGFARLGLSVPRKVGNAVRRNRIKRLLREAFRHGQHDLPSGYDLVINVRPHEPLMLAEYQRLLSKAAMKLHEKWTKRQDNSKQASRSEPDTPPES